MRIRLESACRHERGKGFFFFFFFVVTSCSIRLNVSTKLNEWDHAETPWDLRI